jgi:hypothetical protein
MPILEVLLRQMKRAGIEEVVLTVGHLVFHGWGTMGTADLL